MDRSRFARKAEAPPFFRDSGRLPQQRRASGYYQDGTARPVQLGAHISPDHDTTFRRVGL
jgi:hypothetical protein